MRSSSYRFVAGVAIAAMVVGTLAPEAQAKRKRRDPNLGRKPLVMTSFLQNGRTDVRRNEKLVFKFSALLRRASVSHRSVRIAASTATGFRDATASLLTNSLRYPTDYSKQSAPNRAGANHAQYSRHNFWERRSGPRGCEYALAASQLYAMC